MPNAQRPTPARRASEWEYNQRYEGSRVRSDFGDAASDYALGVYVIKLWGTAGNQNTSDVLGSFQAYLGDQAQTVITGIGAASHGLDMTILQNEFSKLIASGKNPHDPILSDIRTGMMNAATYSPSTTSGLVNTLLNDAVKASTAAVNAGGAVVSSGTAVIEEVGSVIKYAPIILLGIGGLLLYFMYVGSKRESRLLSEAADRAKHSL